MLQRFDWGVVFLVNVPIVLVFLATAPRVLKDVRSSSPTPIDWMSLGLSVVGIFSFTWSLKTGASDGISLPQIFVLLGSVAAIGLFIRRQTKLEFPLLDVRLFQDRIFSIAILTGLLSLIVWSAIGYLSAIYLQSVRGFDVLDAAIITFPGALVLMVSCVGAAPLAELWGRKAALVVTHLLIGGGVLLLLSVGPSSSLVVFIASSMVAGVGYGFSFSLVADVAVSAVPADQAGAAGSIAETSNELGNALGITILGSVAAFVFRVQGPGVAGTLDETLILALESASLVEEAKQAFMDGFHVAVGVGGLLPLAVGLLAIFWLPERMPK